MFSARFHGREIEFKIREVYDILKEVGYDVLMVDAHLGDNFGQMTTAYLNKLLRKKGRSVLISVCTHHYAEKTASQYSSYCELKFAHEHQIPIWPLKVEDIYPPQPPFGEKNSFDPTGEAAGLVSLALPPSLLFLDTRELSAEDIAEKLSEWLDLPDPEVDYFGTS